MVVPPPAHYVALLGKRNALRSLASLIEPMTSCPKRAAVRRRDGIVPLSNLQTITSRSSRLVFQCDMHTFSSMGLNMKHGWRAVCRHPQP